MRYLIILILLMVTGCQQKKPERHRPWERSNQIVVREDRSVDTEQLRKNKEYYFDFSVKVTTDKKLSIDSLILKDKDDGCPVVMSLESKPQIYATQGRVKHHLGQMEYG